MTKAEEQRFIEAVDKLHGAKTTYTSTEHVHETHEGETLWEGDVHVYSLEDHPEASTCYAWAEPIEATGKDRIFAVLELGPVKSPADAVRASILSDYRFAPSASDKYEEAGRRAAAEMLRDMNR